MVVEVAREPREGGEATSATDSTREDAARRQIEEALGRQASIDIDDGALLEGLRQLQETSGVNIVVDSRAIEELGVTTGTKVSLSLSGVTL